MRGLSVSAIVATLAAACLIALVLRPAVDAVRGVPYPYDVDQFRDIAAAQALTSHGLADPYYAGETIWYNPLLPATVAVLAQITSHSIHETYVAAGPYLNLLAPLAFFALAWMLAGPATAVVALTIYLLSPGRTQPWLEPGYSPWLFAVNFAAAFFYAGVICCVAAMRRSTRRRWVAAGAVLGLTFLAHTAPALVLGVVALACVYSAHRSTQQRWSTTISHAAIVIAVALLISAPFLWSIAGRYHLNMINVAPSQWIWPAIDVHHAGALLSRTLSAWTIVAVIGFVTLMRARSHVAIPVLTWAGVSVSLFLYGWLQQSWTALPSIVPQYHFYFYVIAALYLATAIGVVSIARMIATPRVHLAFAVAASMMIAAAYYPLYLAGGDFHEFRQMAVDVSADLESSALDARLRDETDPDAVVLAALADPLQRIGPSGRRVVAVPQLFSNPYVSFDQREAAVSQMFAAIVNDDLHGFARLAIQHNVTNVLLRTNERLIVDAVSRHRDVFHLLSSRGGYAIYDVSSSRAASHRQRPPMSNIAAQVEVR
jgi:hypothetical protein